MKHVWNPQAETEPLSKVVEEETGFRGWVDQPVSARVQAEPFRKLAEAWREQSAALDGDPATAAKQCAADLDALLDQMMS